MTDKRIKMLTPLLVAVLGIVAYWSLVTANPLVPIDRKTAKQLDRNAATDSHEEKSLEKHFNKTRYPSVDDNSSESGEDNSAEVKIFSARVISKVDTENGTVAIVANVQKWEKKVYNTTTDGTVMYFLDADDNVDLTNATIKAAAGNVPCNNKKHQYFREADRCNGIYQCDDNGEDERNCPDKCLGFRYIFETNIADCKAYFPRYFFDFEKHTCTFFIYGGCAKVANMFLSKFECERECANVTWPVTSADKVATVNASDAASDTLAVGSGDISQVPATPSEDASSSSSAAVVAPSEVKVYGETATPANAGANEVVIGQDEELLPVATTIAAAEEPLTTTEASIQASGDVATPANAVIAAVPVEA